MIRSTFFWKLYASYALLVVVGVMAVGALASRRVADEVFGDTETALRARAALMAEIAIPALDGDDGAPLQRAVTRLGRETATRFTVMAADGSVLADSEEDPAGMDNHGSRPEVIAANEAGVGVATRFSRTVAANMMYVAIVVRDGNTVRGYVRAALPLTVVRERAAHLRWVMLIGGGLTAAAALAIGLFVTHRITAPLTSMRQVAEAIADGDYGQRVQARSMDEIGALASAFNRMGVQLEERMRTITEDRSKLLTILGGMVEGVVAVDRERRVVHLNRGAGRILAVDPATSEGRPIWEVTRVREVGEAIDEALTASTDVTREVSLVVGQQERTVRLHAAPLVDRDGERVGAVLVLHDVTELRRLERVRRDFVANVSHELKTPITAIRGLVETILDDTAMPAGVRTEFLGKVQNQSLRLSSLVADLLTLARLESADETPTVDPVDLREVLRQSIGHFRASAEAKRVTLSSAVPDVPIVVTGDGEALELMLNNLLDNAVKYSKEGGMVRAVLDTEASEAVLTVADDGIGIAPEHHDRVFERFYRVDPSRSRELGGTGLGLSIVKHICLAHRGTVTVDSTFGAGSAFRIRLPLA